MKRSLTFQLLLIGALIMVTSTSSYSQADPDSTYNILSGNGIVEIPFELDINHIILETTIQGEKFELILDTGMPMDGILLFGSQEIDKLGIASNQKIPVMGADGKVVDASLAADLSFQISDLQFTHQMSLIMPRDTIRKNNMRGDGVVGYALFSRFLVDINYDKSVITFYEPDKFPEDIDGKIIPLIMPGPFPNVKVKAKQQNGRELDLEMVIDIGANHVISLTSSADNNIIIPEKTIDGVLGRGVNDIVIGKLGRIESFTIGDFAFNNVLTSFKSAESEQGGIKEKHGNIGNGLLSRFNLVFDYINKRLILRPNKKFSLPFNFDMSGLQLSKKSDGHFIIENIIPNSPAEKAGILKTDIITEINHKPAPSISRMLFLELSQQENQRLKLKVKRGETEHQFELTLTKLL